jgi:hypothetical protein
MEVSSRCVVILVALVRLFVARLRKTVNTLWPWDDKEFGACDVDPDRHVGMPSSVRTDCMKQNSPSDYGFMGLLGPA